VREFRYQVDPSASAEKFGYRPRSIAPCPSRSDSRGNSSRMTSTTRWGEATADDAPPRFVSSITPDAGEKPRKLTAKMIGAMARTRTKVVAGFHLASRTPPAIMTRSPPTIATTARVPMPCRSTSRVRAGLGCLKRHQDGAGDVIERAGRLPRIGFPHRLCRDALGEIERAVEYDAQAVPPRAFLQEGLNPARAPERNHVGLRHHQHGIGEVANHLHGRVHAARAIHHDKVVLADQKVEELGKF